MDTASPSGQLETPPESAERSGYARLSHLPRQLRRRSPFEGTIRPTRVPLFTRRSRPALPFPHPWNYRTPIRILDSFFVHADEEDGAGRHNRYLDVPGFAPVLVTRDPGVIRAISTDTGHKPGQFDRDTLPSTGIARATGTDTLLYANGSAWKHQKKLSTPPFARSTLFQPEHFGAFESTFRRTVSDRLERLRARIAERGGPVEIQLEPEIKSIMLEMLVGNFFGAEVSYEEIRERYVPALDTVIDHIVRDTVVNKLGIPLRRIPAMTSVLARAKNAQAEFDRLTDLVLSRRREGCGLWSQFRSDAPDDALRSNIRVFLAGALEATTSYASWAIAHLARHPEAQERCHLELVSVEQYTPQVLDEASSLGRVLDETLRLTPALYFHPRRATVDTTVTTTGGETLVMPAGTHVLLDVWHANRHEDHWGVEVSGHPADQFEPDRWSTLGGRARNERDLLHFGFGHGPRFCPGKSLGQLEVALVVGACVKLFRLHAASPEPGVRAGVSTKPDDGVRVRLELRDRATISSRPGSERGGEAPGGSGACPYGGSSTSPT